MSYSRWAHSKWYAFYSEGGGTILENQSLALWYSIDGNQKYWSYEILENADSKWVSENYPEATKDDINEALEIIECFLKDAKSGLY